MESSWQGFVVGPVATRETMDAAVVSSGATADIVSDPSAQAWALTFSRPHAEALAKSLGDGTWMWEVDLRNDFESDAFDGEDDEQADNEAESHSGTFVGLKWKANCGEFERRMEDELSEEGFIRGGVMQDVALEYVQWYARVELESDADRGAAPESVSRAIEPRRRARADPANVADELIARLIDRGDLEVVNVHARASLRGPIRLCLETGTSASAALGILQVLDDADEVVEIYIDEEELRTLIDRIRRGAQP